MRCSVERTLWLQCVWRKALPRNNARISFSTMHDYVLSVSRRASWRPCDLLPMNSESAGSTKTQTTIQGGRGCRVTCRPAKYSTRVDVYDHWPSGREFSPPVGIDSGAVLESSFKSSMPRCAFGSGKDGKQSSVIKRYLDRYSEGIVPRTLVAEGRGRHNRRSKNEIQAFFPDSRLRHAEARASRSAHIEIATNPGDLGSRLLRRLRHHRRSGAQDGPTLDHGRAGRALPHAYHSATQEGH